MRVVRSTAPGTLEISVGGARLARARAWAATWRREAAPFAALAALALGLRLLELDVKPYHHDESLHAWFSWRLSSGEGYAYDPVYHGPVQFYLIGLAQLLLGAGDFVSRIPPALMGTAIVFLPYFVRKQLGTVAALAASLALCLGPSYLYFSRFAREDIYVACVTLGLVVVAIRFFEQPRFWQPALFFGLLAVAFATKETTYITVFVFGLFGIGAVLVQTAAARRARRSWLESSLLGAAVSLGRDAWAWAVATFLVVFTLLFSTFLTNPQGLQDGLWGSIDYWLGQQDVGRGGSPWFFYLVLMPAYEWPIVLLGAVGVVVALRRRTTTDLFLVWMFACSLAVYSWASERMPWLVLHPLLPLVLLGGIGAQALWNVRERVVARAAFAVVALASVGALYSSVQLSYLRAADPRELLVQVQSSDDVPRIRDEFIGLQELMTRTSGEQVVFQVDSWGGTGWPWSWYLRDQPLGYYDMSNPEQVPRGAPALLVADPNHAGMAPLYEDYDRQRFRLRVWWVPDWGAASPLDWARWAITREPWSPTATMDEWLYVRPDLSELAAEARSG